MKPDLLKNYYTVITDCWKLFKKFADPVEGDEYWNSFLEESNDLFIKHGKAAFSEKMIAIVVEEIENIWKNQNEKT